MKSPLHILHLEDDSNDAALVQSTLQAEGITCATARVQNHEEFVAALEHGGIDLILSDFSLPAFDGWSAAELVRARWPAIPLIFVSGTLGEELAIESLKSGATDYVLKDRLTRLAPAVRRAMREVEERAERRRLEAQFVEAQKMEVIGQLASGVAHDFNNILAVIIGYSDLITSNLGPDSPLQKYTEQIRHASERAAGLTRQLLVFSRKQTVQPVVLDLNEVVKDLEKLLRQLIDENITMTIVPGKQIGRVKADSGHIGQVLMNLVVNARDALPNGGKLTIATNNLTLDENRTPSGVSGGTSPGQVYPVRLPPLSHGAGSSTPQGQRAHTGPIPGDYVMLSVSDTGTGMTDEVKARLFEAFFTTKPTGKGTGLGLATCQTIVQQSGGHIGVQSEIGKGTTFKIYFPRVEQPLNVAARPIQTGPLPRGTETLLVVEDDPSVRHLARGVLVAQGYEVLTAPNGQDALHVAREHKGSPIRLVVTDVIMPLMGGKVMAEWLKTTHPDLKILFTSGYTDDAIAQHGVLESGVELLSKPYTPATLARKVREMLDSGMAPPPEALKGAPVQAPLPPEEEERLQALRRYKILDTDPEQEFDDITLLASHICGTPMAMISLIDEKRQWFKSKIGMTDSETSRDIAFCAHGILQPDVFVIEDALADKRFASNPLVTDNPKIRFYAGSPLVTRDGHVLGMLCVNDRVPRQLSPDQKEALRALSRQIVTQLESRRSIVQLKRTEASLRERTGLANLEADVSTALTRGGTLAEMLRLCSEAIVKHLDAAFARFWTHNEKEMVLELQASAGRYTHLDGPHSRVPVGAFKIGLIASERKPHLTNQVVGDPRVGDQEWAKREGMVAFAGYPLLVEAKLVGVVAMFARHKLPDVTLQALASISKNLALGIERKRAETAMRESEEKFRQLAENIADVFWIRSADLREVHYVSPAYERTWGRSAESLYANPHQWADAILPEDRERVLAGFATLTGAAPSITIEYRIAQPGGEIRWVHVRGFQVRDAADKLVRLTGIVTDITERKRTEESLRASQANMAAAQRIAHFGSWELELTHSNDVDHPALRWSDEMFRIAGYEPGAVEVNTELFFRLVHPEDRQPIRQAVATAIREGRQYSIVHRLIRADGETRVVHEVAQVFFDEKTGQPLKIVGTAHDITERKRAEAELEKVHKELLEASRQAGMAEVATDVLHNVGNVLNSVNIASSCVADSLRKSKAANLSKVVALLLEHEKDLGGYLTRDPKGRQVPVYLAQLAGHLAGEQAAALKELAGLQMNIEHIKDIVAMQQSYAKVSGVTETLKISDLLEDALRMNAGALTRHDVQVIREYGDVPPVTIDKHKVLQVLVNLIQNAKYACAESGRPDRQMTMRVASGGHRVRISISDNGVGIPAENLTRIFNHGFTTRKDGHGFGLHSAALAAKELGGSLTVHSDGPGQGAAFTLELPGPTRENSHK